MSCLFLVLRYISFCSFIDAPIEFSCTETGEDVLNMTENEPFSLQCSVTCDPVCYMYLRIYDMNGPLHYYDMGFPSGSLKTTSTDESGTVKTYIWNITLPDTYDQSSLAILTYNYIGSANIEKTVNIICKL